MTQTTLTLDAPPGVTLEGRRIEPATPAPKQVTLPAGKVFLMYTREQLVILYRCSHGELGRLLKMAGHPDDRICPLPIRTDGQILWYVDEVLASQALVERTLSRWRKR